MVFMARHAYEPFFLQLCCGITVSMTIANPCVGSLKLDCTGSWLLMYWKWQCWINNHQLQLADPYSSSGYWRGVITVDGLRKNIKTLLGPLNLTMASRASSWESRHCKPLVWWRLIKVYCIVYISQCQCQWLIAIGHLALLFQTLTNYFWLPWIDNINQSLR